MTDSESPKVTRSGTSFTWQDLWHGDDASKAFGTSLDSIKKYLYLARNTENPRQYHLWSLLSLTAALCSNSVWFNHGIAGKIKLNLGVVLIGRPALRKGSAIAFAQRFASTLPLNYGPTDTSGARHGIMGAMRTRMQSDIKSEEMNGISLPINLRDFAMADFSEAVARVRRIRTKPSSIYFTPKELGRLLASQTRELLDFFADGLDGESIFYQTKNEAVRIPAPLINLLGATTPGSLHSILPRDSHDHGFLSRIIFVYGSRNEKSVPLPPVRSDREIAIEGELIDRLETASREAEGEITFDSEAEKEYIHLYSYGVVTQEFRLNAYSGRRAIHLVRLAAIICLLRGESPYQVSRTDLGLAHVILILTECDMDAAYMGMLKTMEARAYVLIREVLESLGPQEGEHTRISTHLMKAGWTEQEVIHILDILTRMHKIRGEGGAIRILESIGVERAGQYVNKMIQIRGLS